MPGRFSGKTRFANLPGHDESGVEVYFAPNALKVMMVRVSWMPGIT